MSSTTSYKITAIVSVYNAEEFLRGCLEDLVQQTIFPRMEVLIIDSCSPQNEKAIAQEFTEKYPNILYIRTAERETLYAAWNRGLAMARGEYITNANADDRHAPHALERMAAELDANAEIALVYARHRITSEKNATFATAQPKRALHWVAYDHLSLLRQCEVGPQPLWRKSVHAEVGVFDAQYTAAGDYDMWLRISERYPLLHIPEELGLFLEYDNNLEGQNPQRSFDENCRLKQAALRRFVQPTFEPQIPFAEQFHQYSEQLNHSLEVIKQGKYEGNLYDLELQFFGYALLAARVHTVQNAVEILTLFYSFIAESKNISHLYRFLLMTSFKELPGHLRHEKAFKAAPPRVAVVVPICDQGRYLEEALTSVLAQKERSWEMCLVDDGTHAHSLQVAHELVEKYQDPRIKILHCKKNSKAALYNEGIRATQAPYVCVLEAGSLLVPTYFYEALALLRAQSYEVWVCPKTLSFGQSNKLMWQEKYDFFNSLLCCPSPVSALYSRELWQVLEGYAEDMQQGYNWDFWLRAGEKGFSGVETSQVEFIYRVSFQSLEERVQKYVRCRQECMARHAWWYKTISLQTLIESFALSAEGMMPADMLQEDVVAQGRALYENRTLFQTYMFKIQGLVE